MIRACAFAAALAAFPAAAQGPAAPPAPAPIREAALVRSARITLPAFRFHTGDVQDVTVHYRTLGTPQRDASGAVTNAVMVLHGTGGTGAQFLQPQFADRLFGPGQPLDVTRTFVILPDNIGHGASSKPSDGLRARFARYNYDDMVDVQVALLDRLGVRRLRLLMGTSMGCMHIFVMATRHPDRARAAMPMACMPMPITGHNRAWRHASVAAIRADPAYRGGDYTAPPVAGLRTAAALSMMVGAAPAYLLKTYPTRAAAETFADARIARGLTVDANDDIWALEASRVYAPSPAWMRWPMAWVNSADDVINPPGYGDPHGFAKVMRGTTFRLIPVSPETRGHGTHTWAQFWIGDLNRLLARTR